MRSPFPLDHELGLCHFTTTTPGIGGRLRKFVDDFVVEELPQKLPEFASGNYTLFTLEKKNWETIAAIKRVASAVGVSYGRFGYAGNKDKRALTRQRVSAWRVEQKRLMEVKIDGIRLTDFVFSDACLRLGELQGNAFRIAVRDTCLRGRELQDATESASREILAKGVPNYYGYQRFGTVRPNTHIVGKRIVEGDIHGAVMCYLGRPYPTERQDAQHARRYLDETADYRGALELYPRRLGYERAMLDSLAERPIDYARAIRRLPQKLVKLFVQAYQSYLFNECLSALIEAGIQIRNQRIALIGYRTEFSEGKVGEIEKEVLDQEKIAAKDFHISDMPELSSKGSQRYAGITSQPRATICRDKNGTGTQTVVLEFALPPGSYGTVILREFMKADPSAY